MDSDSSRALQAFRLLPPWLEGHDLIAKWPGIALYAGALTVSIGELTAAGAEQDTHFRTSTGATADRHQFRTELITRLRRVSTIAETAIPEVVAMSASLAMPPYGIDDERLLTAVEAMAKTAEQYHDVLVKKGLPDDFIVQLRNTAAALKQAINTRRTAVAQRSGATKSIGAEIGRARSLVGSLSVMVEQVLEEDPKLMAEWNQLKRATQKGVHRAATPKVAPENPAPSASAPVVETKVAPVIEPSITPETPSKEEKTA